MNQPPKDPSKRQPDHEEEIIVDEAALGRGLKISFVLLALIGAGIGLGTWLMNRPVVGPPPKTVDVKPPENSQAAINVPRISFTDITKQAGIDFTHFNGATGEKLLPETMGGGCAFFDLDGDGDQDILLLNETHWPGKGEAGAKPPTPRLYRNDGKGNFTDVTAGSGLDGISMFAMGVAAGDFDNDGDIDLFIAGLYGSKLLANDGTGRFTDVTAKAGVAGGAEAWSTSAGFFDYDNDGDLDLFVCNYVNWSREIDLKLDYRLTGLGRAYGPPMNFEGTNSYLYKNNGDGTFTEVGQKAGIHVLNKATGKPMGKGLAVSFADLNGDGFLDIVVANDTVANYYFRNKKDGTFEEMAADIGLAFDVNGNATGAMGIDAAHFRNSRDMAIAIGNFSNEMTSFFVSQTGQDMFTDEAIASGIGAPTRLSLTFGLFFFDADLDGRLDMLQANGHIEHDINTVQASQQYKQPAQLFWNTGAINGAIYSQVPSEAIGGLNTPIVGRGAAFADIDGDGDLDVLLTQIGGAPLLLRNDQDLKHHWVRCRLEGAGKNRQAIGAMVELTAGGVTQRRMVMPTRSYLSQVEPTVTFGLGKAEKIDSLRVIWPGGTAQTVENPQIDRTLVITQEATGFQPLMNLSKAYLENGEFAKAIEASTAALKYSPDSAAAMRNLARGHLWAGKAEEALKVLETVRKKDPDSVAAIYLTAIGLGRVSQFEQAIPYFEEAARRDPRTAAIRFQLSAAYEATGKSDKALEQLQQTVKLDPLHSTAHFQLAMAARKAGNLDEFRARNREFLRLREIFGDKHRTPKALEVCNHTKAEDGRAIAVGGAPAAAIKMAFVDGGAELLPADLRAAAMAVIDMDDKGAYTFFYAEPGGGTGLLTLSADGKLARQPLALKLPEMGVVKACIAGNYFDDPPDMEKPGAVARRFSDLFILTDRTAHLIKRVDATTFTEVTQAAGLTGVSGSAARWGDYDHDGDLDLLIARPTGMELWQNNGNGTFKNVTGELGIPAGIMAMDLASIDLDGNDATDLIAARGGQPTLVVENLRAGRFAPMPEPPGPLPAARRLITEDWNNDGTPDVMLIADSQVVIRLGNVMNQMRIDLGDLEPMAAIGIDYDNDGWLDACIAGRSRSAPDKGALKIYRNGGAGAWTDVTQALQLAAVAADLPPIASMLAADIDNDGDTDLLLMPTDNRPRLLRNQGGHVAGQLKLRLVSLMGNLSSIGTRIEARQDEFFISRHPGGEFPIELGLGGRKSLDTVQSLWSNGVVDNRIKVSPGRDPLAVVISKWVDTGSCPFLYVWDGAKYVFISDLLGTSATNLSFARNFQSPVNPNELALIGGMKMLKPREGFFDIVVTGELRESILLDHFKLIAVDPPAGAEVFSTDKLQPPPFGPSELWALAEPLTLIQAMGDDGVDRTEALRTLDGKHAQTGRPLPAPLRAMCHPLKVELDFGPLDVSKPLVLALSGWLEFGTSSSNIALSQVPGAQVIWPTLEAQTADGQWHELKCSVGVPTGKYKTILCDLKGKLPAGTKKLRLITTFEIHWDRIALMNRVDLPRESIHEATIASASLAFRGFSDLRNREPGHPTTADFYNVSPRPHWRTALQGWATRYGDVKELLTGADGKLVVIGSGDAISIKFPAASFGPAPADGRRTYFISSVGYIKEGDPNSQGGDEIGPLPGQHENPRATPEEEAADWRIRYNTRWIPYNLFDPRPAAPRDD